MSEPSECHSHRQHICAIEVSKKSTKEEGWYTKWEAIVFVLLLFVLVKSISVLIPPFQSPDEVNHILRAYTLSQGHWLPIREGDAAGGAVDSGLLEYTDYYSALPFDYSAKEDRTLLMHTENVNWSSKRIFSDFSNTALYFPVPYLPQAAALNIGERLTLSIRTSYFLARNLSLLATLAIILLALLIYPVPMFLIAVYLLPMTLFQMASASMDSVCFAISLLAASLFMRAANGRLSFGRCLHGLLMLCLLVLATIRQNLIFFTLLPAALYWVRRSWSYVASASAAFSLAVAWSLYLTSHFAVTSPYNMTAGEVMRFYLVHPLTLLSISVKTFTNPDLLVSWRDSFIGNLGGLDTPLSAGAYDALTILLILLALITFQWSKDRILLPINMSLVGGGLLATATLFFLMIVIWTPRQAPFIQGVQGRYFTPILMLSGFPLFSGHISPIKRRLCLIIMLILLQVSVMSTDSALIARYWLSD